MLLAVHAVAEHVATAAPEDAGSAGAFDLRRHQAPSQPPPKRQGARRPRRGDAAALTRRRIRRSACRR